MAAIVNGLSLSKLRPFGSTFFIFSDYARPAIRLSALMELPAIIAFTHDAMCDGEAAGGGHRLRWGPDAVGEDLRPPEAGVWGRRAAPRREGAGRGGAGLDVRMGTLRRKLRPRHRHENVRGLRAPEGTSREVRLRTRPGRGGRQGAAGQAVSRGFEEGNSSAPGATHSLVG